MKAYQKETDDYATSPYRKMSIMLMILSVVIIISNLYGLYTRNLVVNLVVTVLLLLAGKCIFLRKVDGIALLWKSCLMQEHVYFFWVCVLSLFRMVLKNIQLLLVISLSLPC